MNTSLTISTSSSSSSSSSSPHSSGSTSPPSSYQTSHTTLFISPTSVTSDTDTDADGDANLNSNSNSNLNSNASAIPPLTSPPTIPSPPTPNLPSHFTLPSLTIPFFPFNPQQWWESKASSSSSSSSSPLLPTTLKDTEDVDEYVNEHVPFLKEEIPERSLRTLQKSVPFLFHLQHGGWVLGYLLMEGITGMIALRGWWRVFQQPTHSWFYFPSLWTSLWNHASTTFPLFIVCLLLSLSVGTYWLYALSQSHPHRNPWKHRLLFHLPCGVFVLQVLFLLWTHHPISNQGTLNQVHPNAWWILKNEEEIDVRQCVTSLSTVSKSSSFHLTWGWTWVLLSGLGLFLLQWIHFSSVSFTLNAHPLASTWTSWLGGYLRHQPQVLWKGTVMYLGHWGFMVGMWGMGSLPFCFHPVTRHPLLCAWMHLMWAWMFRVHEFIVGIWVMEKVVSTLSSSSWVAGSPVEDTSRSSVLSHASSSLHEHEHKSDSDSDSDSDAQHSPLLSSPAPPVSYPSKHLHMDHTWTQWWSTACILTKPPPWWNPMLLPSFVLQQGVIEGGGRLLARWIWPGIFPWNVVTYAWMYLSPFLSFLRSLSSSSSSSSFSSSSLSRPFIAPWRWRGRLSRWFFTSPFSTPSSTTPLFQGGRGWAGSRLFPTWMSSRLSSASLLPTSSISSPWSTQPSTTGWAYLRTSMLAKYSLLHRHGTPFPPSPFSMSLTRTSPLCVSSSPTTPTDQEGGWWWQDWTVSSSFMMYSNALTTLFHGWTRWVTLFYGLLMIQLYFPFTSTSTSNCTSCCTSPFLDSIHVHPTLKNEPSVNVWSLWVQIFMMMYFGYTCFQSVHWVMLQVLQSLALCECLPLHPLPHGVMQTLPSPMRKKKKKKKKKRCSIHF